MVWYDGVNICFHILQELVSTQVSVTYVTYVSIYILKELVSAQVSVTSGRSLMMIMLLDTAWSYCPAVYICSGKRYIGNLMKLYINRHCLMIMFPYLARVVSAQESVTSERSLGWASQARRLHKTPVTGSDNFCRQEIFTDKIFTDKTIAEKTYWQTRSIDRQDIFTDKTPVTGCWNFHRQDIHRQARRQWQVLKFSWTRSILSQDIFTDKTQVKGAQIFTDKKYSRTRSIRRQDIHRQDASDRCWNIHRQEVFSDKKYSQTRRIHRQDASDRCSNFHRQEIFTDKTHSQTRRQQIVLKFSQTKNIHRQDLFTDRTQATGCESFFVLLFSSLGSNRRTYSQTFCLGISMTRLPWVNDY